MLGSISQTSMPAAQERLHRGIMSCDRVPQLCMSMSNYAHGLTCILHEIDPQ